jgi:hypothetical protein
MKALLAFALISFLSINAHAARNQEDLKANLATIRQRVTNFAVTDKAVAQKIADLQSRDFAVTDTQVVFNKLGYNDEGYEGITLVSFVTSKINGYDVFTEIINVRVVYTVYEHKVELLSNVDLQKY